MVDKTSQMFITGPSVVKSVTGEDVTFEELGGAQTHTQISGVAGMMCKDEEACFAQVKDLLSYLPSNNLETAISFDCEDDLNRLSDKLTEIIPEDAQ